MGNSPEQTVASDEVLYSEEDYLDLEDQPHPSRSGGVKTFLRAKQCPPSKLTEDVDIGFIGVPFDHGATREPGARHGPSAVRDQMTGEYHFRVHSPRHNDGFLSFPSEEVKNYNSIEVRDCGDAPTVHSDALETGKRVKAYVERIAEKAMPIIVGGDHYITYPAFVGYADSVGEDVGLIHLDAHTDTSADSKLYGKHYHGSPMARIDESKYGSYDTHAMVGIRGRGSLSFADIREETDLYVDYAQDIEKKGIEASIQGAIDHVTSKVDNVYLTVDIDVVDPGFAPATGTPTFGGLSSGEFMHAMELLGECTAIGAADIMEVAPNRASHDMTSLLAARGVERFLQSRMSDKAK